MMNDEQVKKAVIRVRVVGEQICKGNMLISKLREATNDGVIKMALSYIHNRNRLIFDEHEKAVNELVESVGR